MHEYWYLELDEEMTTKKRNCYVRKQRASALCRSVPPSTSRTIFCFFFRFEAVDDDVADVAIATIHFFNVQRIDGIIILLLFHTYAYNILRMVHL